MREPAGGAGHGKGRHKGGAREADRVEQEGGVDLDIGVEWRPARLEAREGGAHGALDLGGEGEPPGAGPKGVAELIERLAQQRSAGIAEPEDAVAKADQPLAAASSSMSSVGPGAPPCKGPVKAQ